MTEKRATRAEIAEILRGLPTDIDVDPIPAMMRGLRNVLCEGQWDALQKAIHTRIENNKENDQ